MFTYQLQRKYFSIKNNENFSFPNIAEIELALEPAAQFGSSKEPCRIIRKGTQATVHYDANIGRHYITSDNPMEPIRIFYKYGDWEIELQGALLKGTSRCESINDLEMFVKALHYLIPILFIEIPHPIFVKRTSGKIGKSVFNWELQESQSHFLMGSQEYIENLMSSELKNMPIVLNSDNYRLTSALDYYHVAKRLIEAGCSPFEFMSEVILNFAKVLQSLFGQTRNCVREELKKLGYSDDEIESKFITFMSLRDHFDVGHIMFAKLSRAQLDTLYAYLENAQMDFKNLLSKVLKQTSEGFYKLRSVSDFSLDKDKKKTLEKLIENLPKVKRQ